MSGISKHQVIRGTDIAIIGMACRFPGASDLRCFWHKLCTGVESITTYSDAEREQPNSALPSHPNDIKAGAILSDIDLFDAGFFGYSPSEAALIDPQQRVFLECAWEALEDAGCSPGTYAGRIGVYAGSGACGYLVNQIAMQLALGETTPAVQAMLANGHDFLSTRVSYKFNLRGPSVNAQSAGSTGLMVVHLACQSLLLGECDMALAGAVSIPIPQKSGYLYEDGTIQSPDGHCCAFDAAAQGTVFGAGAGVVVLKLLRSALSDGDPIIAVIKGTAVNNDGASKDDFAAPSIEGQAAVIAAALAVAEVDPSTIGYVETHGIGTKPGDVAEIAALTQVFACSHAKGSLPDQYCAIGCVKTNIGDLGHAAGIAGLIKTALALHHREIPPGLHFTQPNPTIGLLGSPFFVNATLRAWQVQGKDQPAAPLRAGVSSFGIGGTNAHVVLEEAPTAQQPGRTVERPLQLFTLSAKSDVALVAYVRRYIDFLAAQPDLDLGDLCYTTHVGRSHFAHRLSVAAWSVDALRQQLEQIVADGPAHCPQEAAPQWHRRPTVAFLFTGQGPQYARMGRGLYDSQPTFRQAFDRCAELLRGHMDAPLLDVIGNQEAIDQTAYTQPAIFALEYALATLWQSWGVVPDIVIGHSLGEFVAACIAGVFSLEDGLKLVAARGRLMGALPRDGEMVSLQVSEARARQAIAAYPGEVSLAVINGPGNVVISGRRAAVWQIAEQLAGEGVMTQRLAISHASHSLLMEPMLAAFYEVAVRIPYHKPRLRIVSNVTGRLADDKICTPAYWVRHVRQAVRFADGVATLQEQGADIFVEIGPRPILLGLARQCIANGGQVAMLPSLRSRQSDWQQMLISLGDLYVRGVDIDWQGFDRDYRRHKVALPTYPFQRQSYWVGAPNV